MHLKRWITGIVAFPILLLLILKGNALLFTGLVSLVCLIGLWEYYEIAFHKTGNSSFGIIPMIGFFFSPLILWAAYGKHFDLILGAIILNLIFSGFVSLFRYKTNHFVFDMLSKQMLGIVYIPVFLSSLILIRNSQDGAAWILLIIILVFSNDTGAFYAGRFFGRHKLLPTVSPGKTIEGALGGLVLSVGFGFVYKQLFLPDLSTAPCIIFFICSSIIGPAGDLFESLLKRTSGVKDSGKILPGHGGILDRIDALIFVAPVAFLFKDYIS